LGALTTGRLIRVQRSGYRWLIRKKAGPAGTRPAPEAGPPFGPGPCWNHQSLWKGPGRPGCLSQHPASAYLAILFSESVNSISAQVIDFAVRRIGTTLPAKWSATRVLQRGLELSRVRALVSGVP
jgi:hypothetical protein